MLSLIFTDSFPLTWFLSLKNLHQLTSYTILAECIALCGKPEQAVAGVSNCWTGIWNGHCTLWKLTRVARPVQSRLSVWLLSWCVYRRQPEQHPFHLSFVLGLLSQCSLVLLFHGSAILCFLHCWHSLSQVTLTTWYYYIDNPWSFTSRTWWFHINYPVENSCETAELKKYMCIFRTFSQLSFFKKHKCIYSTTYEYIHIYIQTLLVFNTLM